MVKANLSQTILLVTRLHGVISHKAAIYTEFLWRIFLAEGLKLQHYNVRQPSYWNQSLDTCYETPDITQLVDWWHS